MTRTDKCICDVCGVQVKDADQLRKHRRRLHTPEVNIKLGDFSITLPLISGHFKCPITNCKGELQNVDTMAKHMKEQHSNSIIVSACPEKQNKKRSFGDDMENFTFNTGCKRALLDQNYNQAPLFTAGLSCQPVAVQFKHPEAKENIIATGIYHSSVVKLITSSLPFQEKKRSLPLEAVVQLYQEDTKDATMVSNPTATPILYDLRLSSLPGLIDACNFVKPDPDLIQFLNFDYRLAPHLMYAVAKLHTGAIVYTEDKNLLLLTCEGYCRSKSADAHAETSKKSIPIDKHSIFIGICDESDGHGAKSKLKIGGYHMNILSTMSADVGLELDINIGPSTDMLPAAAFSIVYPEENVTKFKEIMAAIDDYDIELNINHVRQLVSGFGNVSTYKPYRASMDLLEKYETLMPATVFNLCDFPGNEKYGVSDSAVSMLASRFLNVMASDTSLGIQNISKARFNDAIMTFNANYKSQKPKQWSTLSGIVKDLQAKLDINTNGLSFFKKYGGELADIASSSLSTANIQVKKNVVAMLSESFGKRQLEN